MIFVMLLFAGFAGYALGRAVEPGPGPKRTRGHWTGDNE